MRIKKYISFKFQFYLSCTQNIPRCKVRGLCCTVNLHKNVNGNFLAHLLKFFLQTRRRKRTCINYPIGIPTGNIRVGMVTERNRTLKNCVCVCVCRTSLTALVRECNTHTHRGRGLRVKVIAATLEFGFTYESMKSVAGSVDFRAYKQ
jgi:hypothetical protein